MHTSISWVPRERATAKLPVGIDSVTDQELTAQQATGKPSQKAVTIPSPEKDEGNITVDIDSILANDLNNLAFYKQGEKDPFLSADANQHEIFDEEELEDLQIRATDALIIATRSGEDVSNLEIHVFDDDPNASDGEDDPYIPHTYVHHDLVLPGLPLCSAYTHLKMDNEQLNLVAVGLFSPGIDVWDVDRVNNLEPVTSLGGFETQTNLENSMQAAEQVKKSSKKKGKRKAAPRLKEDSHTDAVMSLSWNNIQREYLASGSADETVKIWDIESAHCARTMSHHNGKVQAVSFHPSDPALLVSGSFDKTVHVADVRNASKNIWNVSTDVETCQWGSRSTDGLVIVSCENGEVSVFDPRNSGQECITKWQAHAGPTTTCAVSRDVDGLLVTSGVDKMIRVWDISSVSNGDPATKVYERSSKAGAVFALSLCPLSNNTSNSSPFVVCYGGAKSSIQIVDLAVESSDVRDRFLAQCNSASRDAILKRASRGTKSKSQLRREMYMNVDHSADAAENSESASDSDSDSNHED